MAKLSPKEAALHAGVSASLVYQWCAERRLPHLRLGRSGRRGKLLIDQAELDMFLKSLRVDVEPPKPVEALRHITRR